MDAKRIVLASASPRRARLLAELGLHVQVRPTDVDETPLPGELPVPMVDRLARRKAAAADARPDELVLAADTIVADGAVALGKPVDRDDARAMLERLRDRSHQVHTGMAARAGATIVARVTTSTVTFGPISDAEITSYLDTDEPWDLAGAYGIQGWAGAYVTAVDGSTANVVGLPVEDLGALLAELKAAVAG